MPASASQCADNRPSIMLRKHEIQNNQIDSLLGSGKMKPILAIIGDIDCESVFFQPFLRKSAVFFSSSMIKMRIFLQKLRRLQVAGLIFQIGRLSCNLLKNYCMIASAFEVDLFCRVPTSRRWAIAACSSGRSCIGLRIFIEKGVPGRFQTPTESMVDEDARFFQPGFDIPDSDA